MCWKIKNKLCLNEKNRERERERERERKKKRERKKRKREREKGWRKYKIIKYKKESMMKLNIKFKGLKAGKRVK